MTTETKRKAQPTLGPLTVWHADGHIHVGTANEPRITTADVWTNEADAGLYAQAPALADAVRDLLRELRKHFPGIEQPVSAAAGIKASYLCAERVLQDAGVEVQP